MQYKVFIPEVHYAECVVNAESYEDALKKALIGEGDIDTLVYSHTLEPDTYEVVNEAGDSRQLDKPGKV